MLLLSSVFVWLLYKKYLFNLLEYYLFYVRFAPCLRNMEMLLRLLWSRTRELANNKVCKILFSMKWLWFIPVSLFRSSERMMGAPVSSCSSQLIFATIFWGCFWLPTFCLCPSRESRTQDHGNLLKTLHIAVETWKANRSCICTAHCSGYITAHCSGYIHQYWPDKSFVVGEIYCHNCRMFLSRCLNMCNCCTVNDIWKHWLLLLNSY